MIPNTSNELILTLSKNLTQKQLDTECIYKSLKQICGQFSLDCGIIYEIDQQSCFHIKEVHNPAKINLPELFYLDMMEDHIYTHLAQNSTTYVSSADDDVTNDDLLELFSSESSVVVSITDSDSYIFGLLIFTKHSKGPLFSQSELEDLSVCMHLLGKYISPRILEKKSTFTQTSLNSILDHTGIDIYVNDFHTHEVLYVNESMAAPYGGQSEFLGRKCWQVLFPGQSGPCDFCPQEKLISENGHPNNVYSWDYQRAFDGSWFRVFSAVFQWIDGRLAHVVSSADITDNKKNEAMIEYLANYDSLTGLPNRRMLINECKTRIANISEHQAGYLLFFDIDGFKAINDNFGHDAGDEFLVMLGEFFSNIPLLKDSIYRNGGDEFVALINDNITREQVKNLAGFIHARFKKPWKLHAGEVYCNTSIGVACYPEDGTNAEDLLFAADQAMYRVKKAGGASVCFSQAPRTSKD